MAEDMTHPVAAAGLAVLARRLLRKSQAATTVTVTRTHPKDDGLEPESVVITTAQPEQDTAALRAARSALVVASLALALAVSTVAWRLVRRELRELR